VRHGAHGVAILGMATETNKLAERERRQIRGVDGGGARETVLGSL